MGGPLSPPRHNLTRNFVSVERLVTPEFHQPQPVFSFPVICVATAVSFTGERAAQVWATC
jgi:hypothetical protein